MSMLLCKGLNSAGSICLVLLISMLAGCSPSGQQQSPASPPQASNAAYQEMHRPQVHFSPPANWMNDPNGMFFLDGTYHLFYQYYPDSTVWGPMHWGHASSQDLIHWTHLPVALYPDSLGYIFSGSAVVDTYNSTGLGTAENPPIIAIFTHHDPAGEKAQTKTDTFQYQSIAYSLDTGETWTKYAQNPVLRNPGIKDFRDPKVFWHESSQAWVMILAVKDRVHLYRSANLIDWELASEFGADQGSHGGVWECPDLFELPVQGGSGSKWVMLVSLGSGGPNGGSATQYFIGEFDGKTFTNDNSKEATLWIDYGTDNYAGVSWSGIPDEQNHRTFIGWMSNWQYALTVPTHPWRSAMTLPRTLELVSSADGIRIKTNWIDSLRNISGESQAPNRTASLDEPQRLSPLHAENSAYHIACTLEWEGEPESLGLEFFNSVGEKLIVGYDPGSQQLFVDRQQAGASDFFPAFAARHLAPLKVSGNQLDLRILMDASAIEVLADDGMRVMTELFFPTTPLTQVQAFSKGGKASISAATYTPLNAIW